MTRETDREKEDVPVHVSSAAKMTDMKRVSMEVPEGKLTKKVSGCTSQNVTCPTSCHCSTYNVNMVILWSLRVCHLKPDWHGYLFILMHFAGM